NESSIFRSFFGSTPTAEHLVLTSPALRLRSHRSDVASHEQAQTATVTRETLARIEEHVRSDWPGSCATSSLSFAARASFCAAMSPLTTPSNWPSTRSWRRAAYRSAPMKWKCPDRNVRWHPDGNGLDDSNSRPGTGASSWPSSTFKTW